MGRCRDWSSDLNNSNIRFLYKEGNYIFCESEGFIFKVRRNVWPPKRGLHPSICTDPTKYFIHLCKKSNSIDYDYSSVKFIGADIKVSVLCHKHGTFEVAAKYLKSGRGCPECSKDHAGILRRKSNEDFIKQAIKVHGDKYDYSLTEYTTCKDKVTILCKEHGVFNQNPLNHLSGKGCRKCSDSLGLYKSFINSSKNSGVSYLYCIECHNKTERFIKVGITSKTLGLRYNTKKKLPYLYEELFKFSGEASEIFNLEKEIHRRLKDFSYKPLKKFAGGTECYLFENKEDIVSRIKLVIEKDAA